MTDAASWQRLARRSSGTSISATPARPRSPASTSPGPDFVKAVNAEIQSASLDDWKTYLRWHLLHSVGAAAAGGVRQGELQFLRQDADRRRRSCGRAGSAASISPTTQLGEALGQQIRRADVRRGRQGAHPEDGGRAREGAGQGYREPLVDDAGDQAAGRGSSSRRSPTRSAIPTSGATIRA